MCAVSDVRLAALAFAVALAALSAAAPARAQTLPPALDDLKKKLESSVALSAFVQVDGVAFRQSSEDELNGATSEPLNQDRFVLQRARLRAELTRPHVSGALELDANTVNGPQVRVFDAYVSGRWDGPRDAPPHVMLTLGLFRIPFGFETGERETGRLFLDRSHFARAFFPGNNDLGVRLSGGYRFLRYSFAAMNGSPLGQQDYPAVDPNKSKDILIRLGVDTRPASWLRIVAGGSGLAGTGFSPGQPSTKDVLVWRDVNENGIVEITEIQAIAGSAATPSRNFDRFALGGEIAVTVTIPRAGDLRIASEVVWAKNLDRGLFPADPVPLGRDLREIGYHVGLTQEITQYAQLGVRYDWYSPDTDASEQLGVAQVPRDPSVSALAIAGAFRYEMARVVVEYDHRTNALGRAPDGSPRTLPDDSLTIRGEVAF
jgi:hypothetical protein